MFFSTIAKILLTPLLLLLALAGYHFPGAGNMVGSTIPIQPAFFETSLASGIGTSDTSLTLAAGTDAAGRSLSGYTCVVLNSGNTNQEVTCGTAAGTSITSLTRGIDPLTGTSSVSALIFSHRRGEDVKITDFPNNTIYGRILSGIDTFPNAISFASGFHPCSVSAGSTTICDKNYIDAQIVAGSAAANTATAGISIFASALQAASSTGTGVFNAVTYNKVLGASYATDTPNALTRGSVVPMTTIQGFLSQAWLDLTQAFTVSGLWTFNGNTVFNGSVSGMSYNFFGTGADGAVTQSGTTTLTRDMYYSSLTIPQGNGILTNGFRIYVTGTLSLSGVIANNGSDGGVGGNSGGAGPGTAGAAGAATSCTTVGCGVAGGAGASGNGASGGSTSGTALGGKGGAAGAGTAGNSGGAGGAGSVSTTSVTNSMKTPYDFYFLLNPTPTGTQFVSGGIGGGGGGSGGNASAGCTACTGAGGGGGGGGGVVPIYAHAITISSTGAIQAKGGNGGNGGTCGGNANNGVGGGGGGGGGGIVVMLYNTLTNNGTITTSGGALGTGAAGAGCQGGTAGGNGTAGASGATFQFQI